MTHALTFTPKPEPRRPRAYIVFDIESAVLDHSGHRRYQEMERWVPERDDSKSRRDYSRDADPLKTPRWPFQTVTTAAAMLLIEHSEGNLDLAQFQTFSAPERDERQVLLGLLEMFAAAPPNAELVTWGGAMNDFPILLNALQRHGLTLPERLRWMSMGGDGRNHHLDLMRVLTGGFKMKPVHISEYAASLDIPAKMTAPAWTVTRLIGEGQWDLVREICEGDVITTSLLLARWRQLHDGRTDIGVVEDRLLRRVIEEAPGRRYIAALEARRQKWLCERFRAGQQAASILAPWLEHEAA